MTPARRAAIGVVAGLALLATACGDSDEQSLCDVYANYLVSRDAVRDLDITELGTEESADIVDNYVDSVEQLRATADGRFSDAIENLRLAVKDARSTLEAVEPDADPETYVPLVEDALQDVREAADRVQELLDPQCTQTTDN